MMIEELRKKMPLPDLMINLGLGVKAKKIALCPFHPDKSPSFGIYQNGGGKWKWKCFAGCGQGDEVDFLEKRFTCSRRDAIRKWEDMCL